MRSHKTLRAWLRELLPTQGEGARVAAWTLVRALLVGYTTNLCQLARQADRGTGAKGTRQYFSRWLNRRHWEPPHLYARLIRLTRRLLTGAKQVALLVDYTFLEAHWMVLQVSLPWQGRALPLYRAVARWHDPAVGQHQMLQQALAWLAEHLPGARQRYVLVMDRGFPSHPLVRTLQEAGWRFVLRVPGTWKMTHPAYTGLLRDAGRAAATPQRLAAATLGHRDKGRKRWSVAHVVFYHGAGYQAPWFLVTSEGHAVAAVTLYRQRMQIEQEFRDLKGSLGLDALAAWLAGERLARFLAWLAVYEWRLAALWLTQRLAAWGACLVVKGRLSWIRVVREWIAYQLRTGGLAHACL